jgi:hypothetical protein
MLGRATLPILFLAMPVTAIAQVNIERLRPDIDREGWSGSIGAALDVRTGSVSLVRLLVSGRVDRHAGRLTTFLLGSGELGFQGGERFSNQGLAHLRGTYRLSPAFGTESYLQVNYDRARLLDFRTLVGGGGRLRLAAGDGAQAWVGSGPMFEYERLDIAPGAAHPARTSVIRWSSYVSLHAVPMQQLVLSLTGYVQPDVGEPGDLRALVVSALSVDVSERVAVTVTFDVRHDSRPPQGIAETDTALRTGVNVQF